MLASEPRRWREWLALKLAPHLGEERHSKRRGRRIPHNGITRRTEWTGPRWPDGRPKFASITGGVMWLDSGQQHGVHVDGQYDNGWLRVTITADDSVKGYAVSVNGRDLPYEGRSFTNADVEVVAKWLWDWDREGRFSNWYWQDAPDAFKNVRREGARDLLSLVLGVEDDD